jgi:uncharacterized protein YpmS
LIKRSYDFEENESEKVENDVMEKGKSTIFFKVETDRTNLATRIKSELLRKSTKNIRYLKRVSSLGKR